MTRFVCDGTCAGNELGDCNHFGSNSGIKPTNATEGAAVDERTAIVHWMRTAYPRNRHAREWADAIEKREDVDWAKGLALAGTREEVEGQDAAR